MDMVGLRILMTTRQLRFYQTTTYSLTCSYFSIHATTCQCWPTPAWVHVAIAAHTAPIAGWRLCSLAEGKVTTEIAFKGEVLSAAADACSHTHSWVPPRSQGAAAGADRPTCREQQKKGAETPWIGERVEGRGNKSAAEWALLILRVWKMVQMPFFFSPLTCKCLLKRHTSHLG